LLLKILKKLNRKGKKERGGERKKERNTTFKKTLFSEIGSMLFFVTGISFKIFTDLLQRFYFSVPPSLSPPSLPPLLKPFFNIEHLFFEGGGGNRLEEYDTVP
jgi:hypothetical protein